MNGRLAVLLVASFALVIFAQTPQARSQTLGTLGTVVTNINNAQTCPPNRNFDSGMTCYPATLSGCPGNGDLQFVFGVEAPGITPNGTIVFFAGDGGVDATDAPDENPVLEQYVSAGYQVVEIAWGPHYPGEDWEETKIAGAPSILVGACRPASFLNWVRNGVFFQNGKSIWGGNGGMCAQGHSAGSGAIAYALTWYNAGAAVATNGQGYLDKVTLDAGPVFSDIRQGCEINSQGYNNQTTFLCVSPGQTGCKGWNNVQDLPTSLEFTTGYKTEVNQWSGNNTPQACANNYQQTTYDTQWYDMSILAPAQGGQTPSFNYTNTTMTAYLCETAAPGVTLNNVEAQGQLYYAQFTNQSQAGNNLSVYAVTNCPKTEGTFGAGTDVVYNNDQASADMVKDMIDPTHGCLPHHTSQ
jgi:hypothetical protein